jgi:hypothetical protein
LKIQSLYLRTAVFTKQFFSIHNLAHLFLQKDRQKSNKLNFFAQQIGVLSALFTHLTTVQSKAYRLRQHCSLLYYKNILEINI